MILNNNDLGIATEKVWWWRGVQWCQQTGGNSSGQWSVGYRWEGWEFLIYGTLVFLRILKESKNSLPSHLQKKFHKIMERSYGRKEIIPDRSQNLETEKSPASININIHFLHTLVSWSRWTDYSMPFLTANRIQQRGSNRERRSGEWGAWASIRQTWVWISALTSYIYLLQINSSPSLRILFPINWLPKTSFVALLRRVKWENEMFSAKLDQ